MTEADTQEPRRIVPVAEATMVGDDPGDGHLKEATTHLRFPETGSASFTMTSDEPRTVGGDDKHPSPIMYFAGAVAMCLLTQITRVARARRIRLDDARVVAELEMRQQGSFARGDARSWSEEVRVAVELESEAGRGDLQELIELSRRTCFVETSVAESIPVRHTLHVNGEEWR